jgi:hypothetical protein
LQLASSNFFNLEIESNSEDNKIYYNIYFIY